MVYTTKYTVNLYKVVIFLILGVLLIPDKILSQELPAPLTA